MTTNRPQSSQNSETVRIEPESVPQRLRLVDSRTYEIILRIYLDRKDGHYSGDITEASTGSEYGTAGDTIAEAVEDAVDWAGVEGFSIPNSLTLDEVREALRTAANTANFDFDVRLYVSF